jgi:hypothetical protein
MAGFTAAGIVEPLDYDFTAIPGFAEFKGTIKEPSQPQVATYLKAARDEVKRITDSVNSADDGDASGGTGVVAMLADMSFRAESLGPEALKRQAQFISALCSGSPSAAQLQKIPHRFMVAFVQWLSKEVLDPEAAAGAGNAQVLNLPSAAAG